MMNDSIFDNKIDLIHFINSATIQLWTKFDCWAVPVLSVVMYCFVFWDSFPIAFTVYATCFQCFTLRETLITKSIQLFFFKVFLNVKHLDCYKLINGSVNAQLTLCLVSEPVSGVLNPHWSVQTGSSKSEPMSPSGGHNLTKKIIFFFFFFTIFRFFCWS